MSIVQAPKFFSIESVTFPGYNITQRGSQLVLAASNNDNPFQLWYRDESWNYLRDAFVYINHGSKMALRATKPGAKATLVSYDPSSEDDTLLWNESNDSTKQKILSPILFPNVALALGIKVPSTPNVIPVIVSTAAFTSTAWKFVPFVPALYKIECSWYKILLTYKTPDKDVQFTSAVKHNDENSVVLVNPSNDTKDDMLWYRIPAGGQEDTTFYSSFIVINKGTGLALKGSTKPGDKLIATEYDPLDYDFVWSEDRDQNSTQQYVSINLSKDGFTNLHWTSPTDDQYQNSAWYHPLTLLPGTANGSFLDRQSWNFVLQRIPL